ncbi:MAG: hypothetical protein MZW92_49705 [Comamonadaceae bacterium]|nr:hypothetical protein [Comamonadaceae bacterium]
MMEGGGNFRANFGVERDGVSRCWPSDGSHSQGRRPHRPAIPSSTTCC